jgi:hypothetical protein
VVKKSKPRKPMPKPSRAIPSRVDKAKDKRFKAYLKLWQAMMDKQENDFICQG